MRFSKLNIATRFTIAACLVTPCLLPSPSASSIGQTIANETTCTIQNLPLFDLGLCPMEEEVSNAVDYMRQTNKPRTTSRPTAWFSMVPRFQFTETDLLPTTWLSKVSCFHFCKIIRYVLQVPRVQSSRTNEQVSPTPIFPATTLTRSKDLRQPMIRSTDTNSRTCTLCTTPLYATSPLHPPMMHWFSTDLVTKYARDCVNALSAASRAQVEMAHDFLQYVIHQTRYVVTSYGSFSTPKLATAASTHVSATFSKTLLLHSSKIVDLLKPALYNNGVVSLAHRAGIVVNSSAAFINEAAPTNTTPLSNVTSLKFTSLTSDLVVDDSVLVSVSLSLLHPPSHGTIFASDPEMGRRFWNRTLVIFDLAVVDQAKDLLARVSTYGAVSGIRWYILSGFEHWLGELRNTANQLSCGLPWTLHLPTSRLATALKRLRAFAVLPAGKSIISKPTTSYQLFLVKPNVVVIDPPSAFFSAAAPSNTTPLSNYTIFTVASFTANSSLDPASRKRTPFSLDLVCGHATTFLARAQATRVVDDIKNFLNGLLAMLEHLHCTATQWQDPLSWTQNVPTLALTAAFRRSYAFLMLSWGKSSIFAENDFQRSWMRKFNVSAVEMPERFKSAAALTNTTPLIDTTKLNSLSLQATNVVGDDAAMIPVPLVLWHPSDVWSYFRVGVAITESHVIGVRPWR